MDVMNSSEAVYRLVSATNAFIRHAKKKKSLSRKESLSRKDKQLKYHK